MTKQFTFTGNAEILKLTTKKQGSADDKKLVVELQLCATLSVEDADFFDARIEDFLFDARGERRNLFIEAITTKHRFSRYIIKTLGNLYSNVALKRFVIEPLTHGAVALTFTASFAATANDVGALAERLQDRINIDLEPENHEMDFEDDAVEAADRLNNLLVKNDTSATISDADGNVLATLGKKAPQGKAAEALS